MKIIWEKIKQNNNLLIITSFIYNTINFNSRKIKGKNNSIKLNSAFLKKVKININGNNNEVIIGRCSRLIGTYIHITGNDNKIIIEDNVIIGKCDLWREDNLGKIKIGKNTTINSGHIACTETNSEIIISEDCMIASNVTFRNGDSHAILDNNRSRINFAKDIHINKHVWIGENAVILKGSEIGEGSIVATGSIVTKKFENNLIVAGNPASIKKEGVYWTRERTF